MNFIFLIYMLSIGIGYWIAIGSACCVSSCYFYYTMRGHRCYYDNQVTDINRNINRDGAEV